MSLKVDKVQLDIIINNDQSRKAMYALDQEFKELQKQQKKFVQGSAEWDQINKKIQANRQQMDALKREIGITGMTMKELRQHQKELNMALDNMRPGTAKYNLLQAELKETTMQMKLLKGQAASTGSSLSGIADGFNKYFGMATAAVATFTGIVLGVRKAIDEFNNFQDKRANLSALTGLQGEDLDYLSDSAKRLSTSTTEAGVKITSSADVIMDAFTKMGSAKPELLKDKEALEEVTKQALILTEASKGSGMVLDDAVQALANTMNQFGAGADEASRYINVLAAGAKEGAKEVPYISEAIVKFGAAAADSNIPIEQSVAIIEALGEKGLQAEVAGTGIRRFLLKLASGADETNPKVVGLETALNNLAAKQLSAGEMMKMFGEEGYIAAQTLIKTKDRTTELTKAITGTNVATEQAIVVTDTNSAKLAQAKNRAQLMAMELGQRLAPAFTFSTNAITYMIKALVGLLKFYEEHRKIINAIVAAIITYTIVVNAQAIAQKALKIATELATLAQKAFNTAMKSNPWGLILSAVAAVVAYIITYEEKLTSATKASEALKEANVEASRQYADQKMQLETLIQVANDETRSKKDRQRAMNEINKISPEYLGNLTLETLKTKEAQKAIDDYLGSLEKRLQAESMYESIKKKMQELAELKASLSETTMSDWDYFWTIMFNNAEDGVKKAMDAMANNQKDAEKGIQEQIDIMMVKYKDMMKDLKSVPGSGISSPEDSGDGGWTTEEEKKKADDANKKLLEDLQRLKDKIHENNQELYASTLDLNAKELAAIDEKYDKELVSYGLRESDIIKLKEKMASDSRDSMTVLEKAQWEFYKSEELKRNRDLLDKKQEQEKRHQDLLLKLEEDNTDHEFEKSMHLAAMQLSYGIISQTEYLEKRKILYAEHDVFMFEQEKKTLDTRLKYKLITQEEYYKKLAEIEAKYGMPDDTDKRRLETRKKYGVALLSELAAEELQELELKKADFNSTEEFEKAKAGITKKYLAERLKQYQNYFQFEQKLLESGSNIVSSIKNAELIQAGDNEEKKKKIKKKYADVEFAIDIASIITKTALGAMAAVAEMPYGGEVMAGLIIAEGAAAAIEAYAQWNSVKGLEQGFYPKSITATRAQDGKKFKSRVSNDARTQFVDTPTVFLAGEKGKAGPEIIIDDVVAKDLQMNAPFVIDAIRASAGKIHGFQNGLYPDGIQSGGGALFTKEERELMSQFFSAVQNMTEKGIKANVVHRDIQEMDAKEQKIKSNFGG